MVSDPLHKHLIRFALLAFLLTKAVVPLGFMPSEIAGGLPFDFCHTSPLFPYLIEPPADEPAMDHAHHAHHHHHGMDVTADTIESLANSGSHEQAYCVYAALLNLLIAFLVVAWLNLVLQPLFRLRACLFTFARSCFYIKPPSRAPPVVLPH